MEALPNLLRIRSAMCASRSVRQAGKKSLASRMDKRQRSSMFFPTVTAGFPAFSRAPWQDTPQIDIAERSRRTVDWVSR